MPINPVELLPVPTSVYQAIGELNSAFEKLIHDLDMLKEIDFFRRERIVAWHDLICLTRAEANRVLLHTLHERELQNAACYDRLCIQWERQTKDPADVLIEAEHYRQSVRQERRQQLALEKGKQRKKAR